MSLRVLHLGASDTGGGAARGAYWLHRGLVDLGVESTMLVERKYSDDASVVARANGGALARRLRAYADAIPLRPYRKTGDSYWSVNWVPTGIDRAVAAMDPDIVHLHWCGGGFLPIEALGRFRRPVVWTLRDMWPFTGGCHYTAGCGRYRDGCGSCPQLRSRDPDDLSRRIMARKRRHWRGLGIWPVAISRWLADAAQESPVPFQRPVEVIPNGVDLRTFKPCETGQARAAWGIDTPKRVVLFGALNALRDRRKGYEELCRAINMLADCGWSDDIELVVFGADEGAGRSTLGVDVRYVGHVRDDRVLARLYACADVMVVPSVQEAFGKTLIEAMACATPVVAFDSGGPADIVVHRRTGYLARPFEPAELARGIAWCLEGDGHAQALGRAARARVESHYDIDVVAGRYRDLYQRIGGART